MKNPICAASYERALDLMAAGCPIDYPDSLPHQSFRAEQLPGYVVSRVFVRGRLDPILVFPLRLITERLSGTIMRDWSLELPWPIPFVDWQCAPGEVIPEKYQDEYKSLFNSPLMEVLNGDRKIRHGHPVDGLLCAISFRPIGDFSHGVIPVKLTFTDDRGNTVPLCIDSKIERLRLSSANRRPVRSEPEPVSSETEIDHKSAFEQRVAVG